MDNNQDKTEFGFKQSHGGREAFPGGEWEKNSEFGKNSEFSDSYVGPQNQDSQVALTASAYEILSDADIDVSNINIIIQDGHAILMGSVETVFEQRKAETSLRNMKGVLDVSNQLKVGQYGSQKRN